ncbi:hypothetical protein [Chamaesiphon sp.]|uniref:hypothetical protein n=1 Tax=Chamaesiphon sp. TaxID=2814140 RepID=UPI0035933D25
MKTILPRFDFKSLYKTVVTFLAVALLVTVTACGGSNQTAKIEKVDVDNPSAGKLTELYKPLTPPQGGMNNYSDVDPRVDISKVEAKADRLIKKTDDLVKKDTNPFKEIGKQLDKKGLPERAEDLSKDVSRSAKETADGVAKGTERGFGNLKENTKSFTEDVKSAVGDLKEKVQQQTEDLERSTRKNS